MKFIIDFIDGATAKQIDAWMVANSVTRSSEMQAFQKVFLVECDQEPTKTEIIETMVPDENISDQLLNTRVEIIPASNGATAEFDHDAEWWKTAALYEVDFNANTSTFERRGAKTTVYVVDSGVQTSHPEFVGANVVEFFSFNDDHSDTNGHGTAIASVIAGSTLGLTSSTVKSVKVFDSSKTTMTSDLVGAFDAILADMLANTDSIAVLNLSWAINKNDYIESKIQQIIDAGAFVVAAAGNNGVPIENVTPASMENVITIGAYTQDFVPAEFSNYTSAIKNTEGEVNYGALDAWAPGVDIGVALIDGSYGMVAGTSIAAAIASACFAYNSDSQYSNIGISPAMTVLLADLTIGKSNMLSLGEKYEGSVNRVASFVTGAPTHWAGRTYTVTRLAYDNIEMHGFLAQPAYVSKIELDKELPEGLTLSNGFIVGRLTKAPDVAQLVSYQATITYTNGTTTVANVNLVLNPPGTEYGDMPEEIRQYAGYGCSTNVNQNNCGNYVCEVGCPNCDPKVGDCPCEQMCN